MLSRLACLVAFVLLAGCLDGSVFDPGGESSSPTGRVARLLTNKLDSRIAIHAYYVPGREPVPAAMDWLAGRLKEVTGKVEVTVEPFVALSTGTDATDTNWTVDRTNVVFAGLDVPDQTGTFELVMLFFDGYGYSGKTAAGFQVSDYLAIFPDAFRRTGVSEPVDLRVPVPDTEGMQDRQVMLHEAGHMLGLVNHGAPMVRDHADHDEACACHSSNDRSIMFPSVDNVVSRAERTVRDREMQVRDFDADDLADLKAFQDAHASD